MKTKVLYTLCLVSALAGAISCSKSDADPAPPVPPTPPVPENKPDTIKTLKAAASFPIGFAIDYNRFMNDPLYKTTVVSEGDNTTFEYEMKHGALVRNNGDIDYTSADALVNSVMAAGLEVFGHTLVWHQNQNGTYLRSLVTSSGSVNGVNILTNGGFETGSGNDFSNWSKFNGAASITVGAGASEIRTGSRSFKAAVAANGNPWSVQLASDLFTTTTNSTYRITFWIKALSAGGKMRVSTGPTASYSPDYNSTTDWQEITWDFVAKENSSRILFDVGSTANTYFIDDISVNEVSTATSVLTPESIQRVDTAMRRFIRNTMTRYAGKVKAWDVVNEPMADGTGQLRNSQNTSVTAGATDYFIWPEYLGRDYALKAFQYAKEADPTALLFINDYNLESGRKLDSLIAYVQYLKGKGAPIDGIGTQMHININTSLAGIDDMFRKLAATGLKVRVSELDIRVNPSDQASFSMNSAAHISQANMYKHVINSYAQNVPAAQRHGITIWNVTDADSWIVLYMKKTDFPLLFNADYSKKPAFDTSLQVLKRIK